MFQKIKYKIFKLLANHILYCGKEYSCYTIDSCRQELAYADDLNVKLLAVKHKNKIRQCDTFSDEMVANATYELHRLDSLVEKTIKYGDTYQDTNIFNENLNSQFNKYYEDKLANIGAVENGCNHIFNIYDAIDVVSEGLPVHKKATIKMQAHYLAQSYNAMGGMSSAADKLMLPLAARVRRIENIDEFVGYQPMSGPVGLSYRLRFKYDKPDDMPLEDAKKHLDEDFGMLSKKGMSLSLQTVSTAVEARSRNLLSGWTIEAMQDANAQHGVDIEKEISSAVANEVAVEMEAEVLGQLYKLAKSRSRLKQNSPMTNVPATIGAMSNEIARKTRRGAGNYVIVDSLSLTALQTLPECNFVACKDKEEIKRRSGALTKYAGILNKTIRVYHTAFASLITGSEDMSEGFCLAGYKGQSGETDCGLIYCPYITLVSSGVVMNPTTYQPCIGLMTRYGMDITTETPDLVGETGDFYAVLDIPKGAVSFTNFYPSDDELLLEGSN